MSTRLRAIIFTTALVLIGVAGLIYSTRALADLIFYPVPTAGLRTQVILKPNLTTGSDIIALDVDLPDAQQVVARRLDQLNLSGSYQLVSQPDQLTITLPESEQMPYIINIITQMGEIEFIDGGVESPPLGRRVETGSQIDPDQQYTYRTLFTVQDIEDVVLPDAAPGQLFYRFVLNPVAAERFNDFAQTQPRHYVCMVLDHQVINCSGMYHWADNTLDILPNLSSGTVINLADLAVFLDSGPLPVPLEVEH